MVNSQITFQPQPNGQSTTICMGIPIINDDILESAEMFVVQLQSLNPQVSADPNADSGIVVIMDDDSKFTMKSLVNFIIVMRYSVMIIKNG